MALYFDQYYFDCIIIKVDTGFVGNLTTHWSLMPQAKHINPELPDVEIPCKNESFWLGFQQELTMLT